MHVLSLIGGIFFGLAMFGALIPGMHFHVNFADTASQIEWHKEQAARLEKKAAQKDQP